MATGNITLRYRPMVDLEGTELAPRALIEAINSNDRDRIESVVAWLGEDKDKIFHFPLTNPGYSILGVKAKLAHIALLIGNKDLYYLTCDKEGLDPWEETNFYEFPNKMKVADLWDMVFIDGTAEAIAFFVSLLSDKDLLAIQTHDNYRSICVQAKFDYGISIEDIVENAINVPEGRLV